MRFTFFLRTIAIFSVLCSALPATAQSEQKIVVHRDFAFEVVSIRPQDPKVPRGTGLTFDPSPDGYRSSLTVYQMIMLAYSPGSPANWMSTPLENPPSWQTDWYLVDARVAPGDIDAWRKQGSDHELLRQAMKSLLKDRFNLQIEEKKILIPDYDLVVGKTAPILNQYSSSSKLPDGYNLPSGGVRVIGTASNGAPQISFYGATISDLVDFLHLASPDRPIRDHTGVKGRYNFDLIRDPNGSRELSEKIHNYKIEKLGLVLRAGASDSVGLMIRHIERPTQN